MGLEAAILWGPRNRALVNFLINLKFNGSKQYTEILSIFNYNRTIVVINGVAERWISIRLFFFKK